jgi:hypothetical protein
LVDIENGIVVARDCAGDLFLMQSQIFSASVLPPGFECSGVEVRAMSVVVEPQTEARAAQSIGPNLGVLAVAAHLPAVPLLR